MKRLLFVILTTLTGTIPAPIPSKPWKAEICTIQRDKATPEYIAFCIKNSPQKYPACSLNGHDPREAMWAAQASGGQGAYFEVLDCSWRPGSNPRQKTK